MSDEKQTGVARSVENAERKARQKMTAAIGVWVQLDAAHKALGGGGRPAVEIVSDIVIEALK